MSGWVWRALLAGLALIAVGAELDRASYRRPELSLIVPGPFRSFAQSPTALLALAGSDTARAQREARLLVRRRPMPADHLFVLAMADLRSGRSQAFANAFRAASTRGWRFAPLQVTAAQIALQGNDVTGAANRIAALWAADPNNPSLAPLTLALLRAKGGPEAFAVPLAQTHVWSGDFLNRAPSIIPAPLALGTVIVAKRLNGRFDCAAVRRFAHALNSRGEPVTLGSLGCA